MKILLSYGANVDSQNDAGRTPLHAAVAESDLFCVQVLVKHGARTDLKDNKGKTALMLAQNMDEKNNAIINFLVEQQE
jgi:ankyrin repeat protein